MRSRYGILSLISAIAAAAVVCGLFVKYYGDWLWFKNMGFASVFATMFLTKIALFLAFSLIFAILAGASIAVSRRPGQKPPAVKPVGPDDELTPLDLILKMKLSGYAWVAVILFLSIVMGSAAVRSWDTFLRFIHASRFGVIDPIFTKDVGFYVFQLPLYQFLQGWYLYAIFLVLMATGVSYFMQGSIAPQANILYVHPRARTHLSIVAGLFFLGLALLYRLKLYGMMYSTRGVAFGASYTDVHAQIPAYWILLFLSLFIAVVLFLSPFIQKSKIAIASIGIYFLAVIIFAWIYPYLLQQYVVKPNEVTKESPYIKNNIRFTRLGYGLDKIREKAFPLRRTLAYADIQKNLPTIQNIRLWDRRPLIQTYKQLQEIRLYYDFKGVDVDRYHFNKYLQVALAARELPSSHIPGRARTWVNIHLIYTHGYGLVMNPVNMVTAEGMPNFIVKDIPPQSDIAVHLTRPEIYYGEETDRYCIVRSKTKEFDYPRGKENVYTTYQGTGGVQLSSLLRRLVYAWKFSDIKILLTGYITHNSRIMLHRLITERDRTIAPFLSYDSDPYIVAGDDGKLYWIHDAYTTSNMYPYSEPFSQKEGERFNYIRNSVKVVIDAYNGQATYYVIDPSDPLVQTYRKIFPALFKPLSEMPAFLKNHLRYPSDLFTIQARMYNLYHMTDPKVFYNQEDLWNIPHEIYRGQEQRMFPYYIIMRLPGASTEEFILMLPLTPSKKNNMVAWMCARCDGKSYGELLVYKLSKEKLIYGPMQIEARINQKPDISSKLTLWGQKGSHVIRGNLLIIPIERSFIYVEPVYLQAEQSQIPELKRVVVAYGDRLQMRKNLDQALRAVFYAENLPPGRTVGALPRFPRASLTDLAQEALNHYNRALQYLRQGNWAGYGEELTKVKRILQSMSQKK